VLGLIISAIVVGLIIGALGRLVLPGQRSIVSDLLTIPPCYGLARGPAS
jgi:hypothetical protein